MAQLTAAERAVRRGAIEWGQQGRSFEQVLQTWGNEASFDQLSMWWNEGRSEQRVPGEKVDFCPTCERQAPRPTQIFDSRPAIVSGSAVAAPSTAAPTRGVGVLVGIALAIATAKVLF